MRCPPGLHFNRNKSVCDHPENANCVVGGRRPPHWRHFEVDEEIPQKYVQ